MVLSRKSWHYWFYSQYFEWAPKNFCPYFWKVILSVIISPIALIFSVPWAIFLVLKGNGEKEKLGQMAGYGFAAWAVLGIVISMVGMFFNSKNGVFQVFGMIGWTMAVILGIGLFGEYCKEKRVISNSFVGKFVHAKKNKYCPKIEWKEEPPKVTREQYN